MPEPTPSPRSSRAALTDQTILRMCNFREPAQATHSLRRIRDIGADREVTAEFLKLLTTTIAKSSAPDTCLNQFEQFLFATSERVELLTFLAHNPRAVEILARIFLGSQYLTSILLRQPVAVYRLVQQESLIEFKSREQFRDEALATATDQTDAAAFDRFRRYQQGEYLRLGICDAFGLMDLKAITVQLSLLADGLVQSCLRRILDSRGLDSEGFVVVACGKLGGEELNYSSDIDLLFLTDADPVPFWPVGQKLIQALSNSTAEGFLYRVDMRLRPWGASGALVNSVASHLEYLKGSAEPWERQALIKSRVIAGDQSVGASFLKQTDRIVYAADQPQLRQNIYATKLAIERDLARKGHHWGEVKSGEGSLRDIEFLTQYLQILHGSSRPELRTFNTLDGLIRLTEFGFLRSDEYRFLSTGYLFLRNVEHALQLMHNKQQHQLPAQEDAIESLAVRLDFSSGEQFLKQYEAHRSEIHRLFQRYLDPQQMVSSETPRGAADRLLARLQMTEPDYDTIFSQSDRDRHRVLLADCSFDSPLKIETKRLDAKLWQLTVLGQDERGILSLICGLLFASGLNILEGRVFTEDEMANMTSPEQSKSEAKLFLNYFTVEANGKAESLDESFWEEYESQLRTCLIQLRTNESRQVQAKVARLAAMRVTKSVPESLAALHPVRFFIDNNTDPHATILHIQSEDTPGFLYEMTNALTLTGLNILRMTIGSKENLVQDVLSLSDRDGQRITDPQRLQEVTTAVLLVKQCMHLLPAAPDPETAWRHLRDFLEELFRTPGWYKEIGDLETPESLVRLTRILGVSDFLWQDFLRLHHDSLLPFVKNADDLDARKTKAELADELQQLLQMETDASGRKDVLNRFKDRQTFRTDMRHMLGMIPEFGRFSDELTDICEVVVAAALQIAQEELTRQYGFPIDAQTGRLCRFTILAMGKCGGRELGYASDIELMFLFEGAGHSAGSKELSELYFFERLINRICDLIVARREGIFELDLRLRPYGSAGPLAVSSEAFKTYFVHDGPAWPFERQSLVKLRPIAGDISLAHKVLALRDQLIYAGRSFDVSAMRGMREKQILQLVEAGQINVKLSPGGLVDLEYLVQGLQIAHGVKSASIRVPNTLKAIEKLCAARILTEEEADELQETYIFLRRLIDALRMVRGNARDLTIPPVDSDEFEFLARRLGFLERPLDLVESFESLGARLLERIRKLEERGAFLAPTV